MCWKALIILALCLATQEVHKLHTSLLTNDIFQVTILVAKQQPEPLDILAFLMVFVAFCYISHFVSQY